MLESTEEWRKTISVKLADLLDDLDAHHEPLVAAHVAIALDCLGWTRPDPIVDVL